MSYQAMRLPSPFSSRAAGVDFGSRHLGCRLVFLLIAGTVLASTAAAQTFTSDPPPLPIPDAVNDGGGDEEGGDVIPGILTSTISVPVGTGTISGVTTLLNLDHTFVGDLFFRVTSPSGTEVILMDRPGVPAGEFGNPDDLSGSYLFDDTAAAPIPELTSVSPVPAGSYLPDGSLASFVGELADGDWVLFISDNAAGDAGTLAFWQLILMTSPIGGEIFGTAAQAGVQTENLQYRLLRGQTGDVFGNGQDNDGFAMMMPRPALDAANGMQLASYGDGGFVVRAQNEAGSRSHWNGWAVGYGVGGNVQPAAGVGGLDYASGGTQVGIYRWTDEATLVGAFGSYGYQGVDLRTNESANVNSGTLGGFMRRGSECEYYLLAGALGYDGYNTARAAGGGVANGNYDGLQGSAYVERGWNRRWRSIDYVPAVALQYIGLHQNGFTETGAGALTVAAANTNSLRSLVGVDVQSQARCTRLGSLSLQARGHWMHEFLATNTTVGAAFGGGPAFSRTGLDFGRDWALIGAGINLESSRAVTFRAGYDLQVNDRQAFHGGTVSVAFQR